ncbi:MAG: hypothetical protein QM813_17030 [Verrucomicrobiota bacterium]
MVESIPMLALAWRFRKWIGIALLALAIGGWLLHQYRAAISAAEARGEARIKIQWTADTAARDKASAEAIAASRQKEQAALAANEVIVNDYTQKLVAAAGERDGYFGMLQRARGEIRSCTSARATDSVIAATAGEATIAERIDRATAGVIVESKQNADQLDALISVIKGQLNAD